ncbi:hypothetical protein PR048_026705 [Dryococelus australis]|uniref:Uncharacterized protein n=1 Tax=Dryococelus australis TaxID=614101 RepID=A0ABQ9GM46_9NEOP|nr:hypothetical protein PR048_026705 [Dryococelus australis]
MVTEASCTDEGAITRSNANVNNGTPSVNKAACVFYIPRRTLRDHLKMGSAVRILGGQTYLSAAGENELRDKIFRLCDTGSQLNLHD